MIFVRSNHKSLKYQRFTLSGCKDIGIRKFKFVAKTQFICLQILSSMGVLGEVHFPVKAGFPS